MTRPKFIIATLISIMAIAAVVAQTPRRQTPRRPAAPRPTPSPATIAPAQPTPVQPTAPAIAIVNDVTVAAEDIQDAVSRSILADPDLYLRAFYEDRDKAIREARQRALDVRVNSMLVAAAAKRRAVTTAEFLDQEINSRIPNPSATEIQTLYDANRDQLGNSSLEVARPMLINYLKGQRSEELYAALVTRLKMTNTVMKATDVNAPHLAPGVVLASVNAQPIRVETINERMKAYIYKMEMRIYAAQKQALDRRINDLLFIAEASKRNIGSEQLMRTEITEKLKTPTEAEIAKFYDENKTRMNGDLASTRVGIATYLEQQQQEKLETALAERLRGGAKIQVLLKEPAAPVMNVGVSNGPSRGDAKAPVTVVEFTDFQCSACGGMYPLIEEVVKSYGNRIHFVIRDFPLTSVHENAFKAAEAAAAAHAQGKFWEYTDLLFKNQSALDVESLKKYATQVGLDRKRFDAELESGAYADEIRRDIEDGEMLGIDQTPTIYVNGVMLTEFSGEGLRAAIERAFAKVQKR